jgi:rod shape-determining protein MreD
VKKFLLPLMLFFLFILESIFVQYLPANVFGQDNILVPHFLIAAILLVTIYISRKQGIIYAMIFGLLYDIVYVEIIGINLFLFPFVTYIVSKIMNVMQTHIITAFLVSLVGIAFLEIGIYEMNSLIHITSIDFMSFLKFRFYPTLLLNTVFLLLAIYPLKRQFEKYAEALDE